MWWVSNDKLSKKELDFLPSRPHDLDDLILMGDLLFTVGVPFNSDVEFRKRIFAAAKS